MRRFADRANAVGRSRKPLLHSIQPLRGCRHPPFSGFSGLHPELCTFKPFGLATVPTLARAQLTFCLGHCCAPSARLSLWRPHPRHRPCGLSRWAVFGGPLGRGLRVKRRSATQKVLGPQLTVGRSPRLPSMHRYAMLRAAGASASEVRERLLASRSPSRSKARKITGVV